MFTVAPSPALRWIWMPPIRCRASATVTSGSLPMSSAEIASTTAVLLRLMLIACCCDARMPVTTISSSVVASGLLVWVVSGAVCAIAGVTRAVVASKAVRMDVLRSLMIGFLLQFAAC